MNKLMIEQKKPNKNCLEDESNDFHPHVYCIGIFCIVAVNLNDGEFFFYFVIKSVGSCISLQLMELTL